MFLTFVDWLVVCAGADGHGGRIAKRASRALRPRDAVAGECLTNSQAITHKTLRTPRIAPVPSLQDTRRRDRVARGPHLGVPDK